MTANFKLKPIALAMIPILFAGGTNVAFAEESEKQKKEKEKDNVEVIEVVGYKGSVQRAINAKRLADGVQDSVFAEDIGKSTDQNIADALSRITGVTVQEEDGEGTRISVRGAAANLNQISLNGVALTSSVSGGASGEATSDQSVDLSTFSSDILSSINVIKTAAADHDEGSLGANVILRTVKPLLVNEDRRSLEVQGRHNEYAEENDYKVSGTFSEKFLDETFGIIVTGSKETSSSRRDQLGGSWLAPYQPLIVEAGRATSERQQVDADGNLLFKKDDMGEYLLDEDGNQIPEHLTQKDQRAFIADGRSYSTDVNTRERTTITAGFQFLPTDVTDVQLDLSYSKQEYNNDTHRIGVGKPRLDTDRANLATDPQADWWTIDEESRTLTKTFNRYGGGNLFRGFGGNETENKVATLKIDHEITDDLTLEVIAGYSRTDYESKPNAQIGTANWRTTGSEGAIARVAVEDLQPVGWDCTSGECILRTGDKDFEFVPGGNGNGSDNILYTGFNPYDPHEQHLGYAAIYDETSIDENKSLFVNFDWAVDFAGITMVEFGAKYSERTKDVFTDRQSFTNADDVVFDDQGNTISGKSAVDVKLVDVLEGHGLPVDNFMDGIVGRNSEYNQAYLDTGWGILSPRKALDEIFASDNFAVYHDNAGDRSITQDNTSAYFKLNFEYFDSRLTGNIGLRYVKTENTSTAFTALNYSNQHGITVPSDIVLKMQLHNPNLAACTPHIANGNADEFRFGQPWEERPACYDPYFDFDPNNGGWQTSPGDEDTTFKTQYAEDPNNPGQWLVTQTPGLFDVNTANGYNWWQNWSINDMSTSKQYRNDALEAGITNDLYAYSNRRIPEKGSGESTIYLPSLNLNYAISDELIARFATSKTMARPRFDSMKPGFTMNENVWNAGANRINVNNPDLKPLESENIDLSFEWYFNKTGLLSLAYFRKDMKNFEESIQTPAFGQDLRRAYNLESLSFEEFFILPGVENEVVHPVTAEKTLVNEVNPTNTECHPVRKVQGGFSSAYDVACQEFVATLVKNGKGALTEGVELGYSQSFDFLPGALSGLGVNFNYTFQDSESDVEVDEEFGFELKPLPQAYTPRHSANTTLYWEKDGHQLRFTHRYNGDQLVNRAAFNGATWQDQTHKLDFSATYKWSENVTFTFHALNLTDDVTRTYWTSTSVDLGDRADDGSVVLYDEGNALKDDVDESRTVTAFKTGKQYRFSARINF